MRRRREDAQLASIVPLGIANVGDEVGVRCEEALGRDEDVGHGSKQSYLSWLRPAMGKATKSTRKFASSGQLKKTIQSRKKHQQAKNKIKSRRGARGKGKDKVLVQDDDDDDDDSEPEVEHATRFIHDSGCYYQRLMYFAASRECLWMTCLELDSWRTVPRMNRYAMDRT